DFEGNLVQPHVHAALHQLASRTSFLRVLGSYPARTTQAARPAEPRPVAAVSGRDAHSPASPSPGPTTAPAAAAGPAEPELPHKDVLTELEKKPYKLASRATRAKDSQFRIGSAMVGGPRQVIIAGPCSVESREQIFVCARIVKELGGHLLRGGCFKP